MWVLQLFKLNVLSLYIFIYNSSMKTRTHSSPILFVLSEPFYSYTGREFPGLVRKV